MPLLLLLLLPCPAVNKTNPELILIKMQFTCLFAGPGARATTALQMGSVKQVASLFAPFPNRDQLCHPDSIVGANECLTKLRNAAYPIKKRETTVGFGKPLM